MNLSSLLIKDPGFDCARYSIHASFLLVHRDSNLPFEKFPPISKSREPSSAYERPRTFAHRRVNPKHVPWKIT
ncbi:hypothetical protein BC938DRAFT_476350 [Jimgerdemannia flammicorona]|uniref:Uncharacterized protein n=1 Tax=Jimgerdemannia flammicorona TaxID=994334 RepID=A0A433PHS7_9FUNG|nr:hypothetical protein BC938DRAFT_476350 [Jimgerdemannia flammicorona]